MTTTTRETATQQTYWPVSRLRPHPANPRGPVEGASLRELAESIAAQGVLQPLLICPDGTVVAGHRRLAAARLAGLGEVPVIVKDLSEREILEAMLAENVQRQDLTPIQEAEAFARLLRDGGTQADLARRLGVGAFRISSRLALLRLTPEVQQMIHRGELSTMVAGTLLTVGDPERQRRLAALAVARRWSVKQAQALIQQATAAATTQGPRRREREPETVPTGEALTRAQAIRALRAQGTRQIRLERLADMMASGTGVCASCGESADAICRDCPLTLLVRSLV